MTTPKPLTADEIADLKAKAKAATPGPWVVYNGNDIWVPNSKWIASTDDPVNEQSVSDADYIAAANPETLQRALATIKQQAEQIKNLRAELADAADRLDARGHQLGARKAREALAATEPKP